MNFFLKKNKKNKKNLCGAVPRTPQRDPQNLCLQGKWMPLTVHLAYLRRVSPEKGGRGGDVFVKWGSGRVRGNLYQGLIFWHFLCPQ